MLVPVSVNSESYGICAFDRAYEVESLHACEPPSFILMYHVLSLIVCHSLQVSLYSRVICRCLLYSLDSDRLFKREFNELYL